MNRKKRVLFVTEGHFLHSGFGTYAKEVITRLHNTNKYNIAEFASYSKLDQAKESPWMFYGNLPNDQDEEGAKIYNSNPTHQFGLWRFEKICLDFKPDIVLCYRDPWMDDWIKNSATRPYFHWVWMPTVDSAPQKTSWVDTFSNCDAVLTYSEFGGKILKKQGKEKINYIGCASPGIDPSIYKPIPKKQLREELGLDPNCFIIGTVMRNQKRKLFFELMKVFKLFLKNAPSHIASKTFLYLHTSYPEKMGWDIAQGIMEYSLGGKVLMTYICKICGKFFPSMFNDALCKCKYCGELSSVCPTVSMGVSIPDLAKIYNLFDIYMQYAICEGFGMPQVEAAACGIPVMATDYSAMYDVVRHTKGYPIPVRTFFRELETDAERAYPDNEKCAEMLVDFFSQTDQYRMHKSMEVRKGTIDRYNWDATAKVWESYIDSYTPVNLQSRWDTPANIKSIPDSIPEPMSNQEFINWIFEQVAHDPEKIHALEGTKLFRDLTFGAETGHGLLQPINRQQVFNGYKTRAENFNTVEHLRVGNMSMSPEYFIVDAHSRYEAICT